MKRHWRSNLWIFASINQEGEKKVPFLPQHVRGLVPPPSPRPAAMFVPAPRPTQRAGSGQHGSEACRFQFTLIYTKILLFPEFTREGKRQDRIFLSTFIYVYLVGIVQDAGKKENGNLYFSPPWIIFPLKAGWRNTISNLCVIPVKHLCRSCLCCLGWAAVFSTKTAGSSGPGDFGSALIFFSPFLVLIWKLKFFPRSPSGYCLRENSPWFQLILTPPTRFHLDISSSYGYFASLIYFPSLRNYECKRSIYHRNKLWW